MTGRAQRPPRPGRPPGASSSLDPARGHAERQCEAAERPARLAALLLARHQAVSRPAPVAVAPPSFDADGRGLDGWPRSERRPSSCRRLATACHRALTSVRRPVQLAVSVAVQGARRLASKPLPCRIGLHSRGTSHPTDERRPGPDRHSSVDRAASDAKPVRARCTSSQAGGRSRSRTRPGEAQSGSACGEREEQGSGCTRGRRRPDAVTSSDGTCVLVRWVVRHTGRSSSPR